MLYRAAIFPLLAIGYRIVRFLKKQFTALVEYLKDGALRILANKYAIHAAVVIIALFVTTTNIYASGTPVQPGGQDHSILSGVADNSSEGVLVEEVSQDGAAAPVNDSQSYLGGQAVSTQDSAGADATQYNGTESGAYTEDDISGSDQTYVDESPLSNAVRPQPEGDANEAPPTRTRPVDHVVQDGETLGSIARDYGISVETILAANKLRGSSLIHPGDKLRILPVDGIAYTVKKGDTLNKIASTYKSDPDRILQINGIADASSIALGDELVLPDGRMPPPPAPPRSTSIATNIKNIIYPPASTGGGDRFIWPTAVRRITQLFGAWEWGTRHTGVDIAGPIGTPIYAADDGVVISSGWNSGGYGNMIIIDHGGGWFTRYGHSSKLLVKVGESVKKGQVISLMGSTGRSTGPHLHFEIMTGDVHHRINPLNYIR